MSKYFKAFSFLKNLGKGQKTTGSAIKSVKPNVPKTKMQKGFRDLQIGKQKLKGSTAKLKQTQFEIKQDLPITFKMDKTKTMSNTELKDQADYLNKTGKYKVKKDKNKNKTKVFNAPKNFKKGGKA